MAEQAISLTSFQFRAMFQFDQTGRPTIGKALKGTRRGRDEGKRGWDSPVVARPRSMRSLDKETWFDTNGMRGGAYPCA